VPGTAVKPRSDPTGWIGAAIGYEFSERGARIRAMQWVKRRQRHHYSEYLRLAADSNIKLEFVDGEIYAMAGGSRQHSALIFAISVELGRQLEAGPCSGLDSNMRVRALATGRATYPDITVVCGPVELDPEDDQAQTALNPTLIVEVLSDSTEEDDRGPKFTDDYATIPTLRQYVLVEQHESRIEVRTRGAQGWTAGVFGAGAVVVLDSIGCTLDVDRVYRAAAKNAPLRSS
jgi:Uma2 family endonuclease